MRLRTTRGAVAFKGTEVDRDRAKGICWYEGASAVEFALVFPLLAMLLFGMMSGGLALNRQQQINHAAREAVRFGATLWEPLFPDSGAFDLTASRVRTTMVDLQDSEDVVICVAYSDGTTFTRHWYRGTDLSTPSPLPADAECPDLFAGDSSAGERVQVSVRANAQLEAVLVRRTVRLNADAVSIYEPRQ